MSVTISKTNKPLNPRAKDLSPKGYNRASLYSGKALDFDGVNDEVTTDQNLGNLQTLSVAMLCRVDNMTDGSGRSPISQWNSSNGWMIYKSGGASRLIFYRNGNNFTWDDSITFNNQWIHLVYVIEQGVGAYVYANGELVASDTSYTSNLSYSTSPTVKIGTYSNTSAGFLNGGVSGVKIFNTALTAGQVSDLYNNPEKIVPDGVTNSALKLWLPMMEGAGTTVYDGSAPLTDYVTNGDFSNGTTGWTSSNATLSIEDGALKITSTGGNRPQANQTISGLTIGRKYLLSALSRVGTTAFDMEIEIAGIAASSTYNKTSDSTFTYIYYEFTATSTSHQIQAKIDDGAVGVGETGYFDDIKLLDLGNYGSISGATWTSGVGAPVAQTALVGWNKMTPDHTNTILAPQGLTANKDIFGNAVSRNAYALNLDGASWAEVHDNASLDITDAITLEAWVYWDDSVSNAVLGKWDYSISKASYLIYKQSATNFRFFLSYNGTSIGLITNSTTISNGWNHLIGVYDGVNIKCYLNGSVDGSTAYSAGIFETDLPVNIGKIESTTSPYAIALPRIYNRALTATEVARNYNADKSKFGL